MGETGQQIFYSASLYISNLHGLNLFLFTANEPGNVQLEIRYAKPVFGTDFDVIFEASCSVIQ
jgi:hypothetical protein